MKRFVLFVFLSINYFSVSQELTMTNGSWTECGFLFADSNGSNANYDNNENFTLTLCPQNDGDMVMLSFLQFSTQLTADVLTIYNGDSTNSPLLVQYSGPIGPSNVIADNSSGCLTLNFVSDATVTDAGWLAEILCVTPFAIVDPTDYVVCDAIDDGVGVFDLESKNAEILGGQSNQDFNVTYHEVQSDAELGFNALPSPFTNTSNPQTLYVRVEDINTGLYQLTQLTVFADVIAESQLLDTYEICDGSAIAVDSGIDDISYSFEWYLDGFILPNEDNSSLLVNQPGYYSLFFHNTNGCFGIDEFQVLPSSLSIINPLSPYQICDDNDDGFAEFDLSEAAQELSGIFGNPLFQITYYETVVDAENGTNPLLNTYTNITAFNQTIYVKIDNINGDCFEVLPLELIVATDCLAVADTSLEICTDSPNAVGTFDLTVANGPIVNGQDPSGFVFSYYISETNAIAQVNAITDVNSYMNTNNPQLVYVRVEEIASGDVGIAVIELIAHITPVVEFNQDYTICDGTEVVLTPLVEGISDQYSFVWNTGATDPEIIVFNSGTYSVTVTSNATGCTTTATVVVAEGSLPVVGEAQDLTSCLPDNTFDLTTTIDAILQGASANDFIVSFYTTYNNAFNDINVITNPSAFTTTLPLQTIYVRVQNTSDTCFTITDFSVAAENACPIEVNCGDGPVNTTYCYGNADTTQFVFESSDGSPLSLVFNAGTTEVDWDEVYVLDSDGTILNADLPYGNNGDFSGLSYISTGNRITVMFNSDGTINCQFGSSCCSEVFDFDVQCTSEVGIIEVSAFVDGNSNTVFDNNEVHFNNGYFTYEVNNDGVINTVNSSSGSFVIFTENATDTYDISFNLYEESAGCYDVTIPLFSGISAAIGDLISIDFPVVEEQNCEDLAVYLVNSFAPPRPGFSHSNRLILENLGFSTITSGTVSFDLDPQLVLNTVSNLGPNVSVSTNASGFTLDFVNFQPGQTENIYISLTCPASVPLDEIVTNTATYTTAANDLVAINNFSTLSEVVVGSWDPNDKMEAHGPRIDFNDFSVSDEYLYYTIRFQNLGTAAATFVRIDDVLDAQLDASSFQMLRASHDYVVTRTDNAVEWFFDTINLPAEQDDAEGSQGYVYFRVKPNPGYALGDIIPNNAAIYFDFNAPVITNTFNSEFVEENLSTENPLAYHFEVWPNPSKYSVQVTWASELLGEVRFQLTDLQGKLILERTVSDEMSTEMDISGLQSGLYFLQISYDNKTITEKLVKD